MSSKIPQPQSLKTYLDPKEIDRLIAAAPTLRDKIIIRFLFRTACRVSELCALRVENIDLSRRLILIDHLKRVPRLECPSCGKKVGRRSNFCPYCGTQLTEASPREITRQRLLPLDRETCEVVAQYLAKRRNNDDRLIALTRQMVYTIVREAAEKAGLGGRILLNPEGQTGERHYVSPHKLRDAHAIEWLSKRDDPEAQKALQDQLGHVRFDTTARYLKFGIERGAKIYDEVFGDEHGD